MAVWSNNYLKKKLIINLKNLEMSFGILANDLSKLRLRNEAPNLVFGFLNKVVLI